MKITVRTGLDRIADGEVKLPKQRYGFVTAAHARSADGQSARLILQDNLRYLFSPEHGLDGAAPAGQKVQSSRDSLTGLPVHSLYQSMGEETIPGSISEELDAIIYDLPDVGVRFYTYVSTFLQILDLCAELGKPLFVLDRPNPLGGEILEGPVLKADELSFVGAYTLPIRYGLTIAEIGKLYIHEKNLSVEFEVIECDGWQRTMLFPETGQVFTIPSPNLPNFAACLLYPGTCLFEGTNLSEGRGTARPFSWFGAPYIDRQDLFEFAQTLDAPGIAFRPQSYLPSSSKHSGEVCHGLAIEVLDPKAVRMTQTVLQILDHLDERYEAFEILAPFDPTSVTFMHRLLGKDGIQAPYSKETAEDHEVFRQRMQNCLIYD